MSNRTALPAAARRRIEEIGQADVLVGIPSFNSAKTIAHVMGMAAEGLVKHFPQLKPALIVSDGHSTDDTRSVALNISLPQRVERVVTTYEGVPGKGSALRAVFKAACTLGVQACVVVDSDLRSIIPEWVGLLASPIIRKEFDYVTPHYLRHKYNGTITKNIAYPMTRMLYGLDVRQPIGGDFGFSGRLAQAFLAQGVWDSDVARFGIDIWMTTTAINAGAHICQASLGVKLHHAKDPAKALGPMFRQVVGTLFTLMGMHEKRWRQTEGVKAVPFYGPDSGGEPDPVGVSLSSMIDGLCAGWENYHRLWSQILTEENLALVQDITSKRHEDYDFSAELWARMVMDFAVAYNKNLLPSERVVEAMIPLYLGRTAAFVQETSEMTTQEAERVVQAQAEIFEGLRSYLRVRWDNA
jgi:hypothetical protein